MLSLVLARLPVRVRTAVGTRLVKATQKIRQADHNIDLFLCRSWYGRVLLKVFGPISILSLPVAFIILWLLTLYWGERSSFSNAFGRCEWDRWEDWVS